MEVLTQKYDWPIESAGQFASFLIPMLAFDQDERATARQCLQHDWLKPNGGKPLRAMEKQQAQESLQKQKPPSILDPSPLVGVVYRFLLFFVVLNSKIQTSVENSFKYYRMLALIYG